MGIYFGAALGDDGHVLELQHAKGGVDFAHLAVDAGGHHCGFVDEAEVLQVVDALFGFGVRADDGAAFKGVEDFCGVKTEHGEVAMVQHAAAMALHAKGVGGVVNHLEVVVVGDLLDGIDVTGVAIAVHGHDGRGLRGDGGLDLGWIDVECGGLDVDKHRFVAIPEQGMCSGNKAVGGGDDFARDAQGLQGGDEGNGAV